LIKKTAKKSDTPREYKETAKNAQDKAGALSLWKQRKALYKVRTNSRYPAQKQHREISQNNWTHEGGVKNRNKRKSHSLRSDRMKTRAKAGQKIHADTVCYSPHEGEAHKVKTQQYCRTHEGGAKSKHKRNSIWFNR
jgi:hypothetical protein